MNIAAYLRTLTALAFALLLATASAQDFVPVPPLQARVTDLAGMLEPKQRTALENVLQDYEQRTGSQIAILLVKSTAPEAIEQYSIRVFDQWKLGRKGVDDGVLLLVAKDNPPSLRRMRIEAGRGVQGSLTDAQSKRILQDVMAPYFRQDDFYGGLAAGTAAIEHLLDKEQFPAPAQARDEQGSGGWSLLLFLVFMIIIVFSRARRYGHRRDGWGRSSGVILGGSLGGLGGYGDGGFRGGGFGGGGFGGGGFSGGGGSADGGGASGNW